MTADNPTFATVGYEKGHWCGHCKKGQFLHSGCVVDNSFKVAPNDPRAVASRLKRDLRLAQAAIEGDPQDTSTSEEEICLTALDFSKFDPLISQG